MEFDPSTRVGLEDALPGAKNGFCTGSTSKSVTDVTDVSSPRERRPENFGLLYEIEDFLEAYIAYPSEHARVAHLLWIVHTHLMDIWHSTPRLAFLSTEPSSGKSRALEVTQLLVPRPELVVSPSAAYLFRKVSQPAGRPTILFDEIDTIFGAKSRGNEDIRALLNAGHSKGQSIGRCVERGNDFTPKEYPAYCAVAIAGLGNLPNTILSRSIVVRMRPPRPDEHPRSFRRQEVEPVGHQLRDRLANWAPDLTDLIHFIQPATIPEPIRDRRADVWEPLISIADAGHTDWRERAYHAALAIEGEANERTPSLGIRLLGDLRQVFGDRDKMPTAQILEALNDLQDAPWADLNAGKPLDSRRLGKLLQAYDIKQKSVRVGQVAWGLAREDLADAWARYVPTNFPESDRPTSPPNGTVTTVTAVTARERLTGDDSAQPDRFEPCQSDDLEDIF